MSDSCRHKLPQGLPACLVSHDTGFSDLCRLLHVETRAQKQTLVNSADFKKVLKDRGATANRDLKTAERLQRQITDIYGFPDVRRKVWKAWFKGTEGFRKPVSGSPPSLEYQALRQYDPEFHERDIDEQMLLECASFYQADVGQPDWRSPALALLPPVHADLRGWTALEDERRRSALVAAFAIATLLDDARLLRWAAERHESLAAEFQFAEEEREAGAERYRHFVEDRQLDGDPASDAEDGPRDALRNACERLSHAARDLGDVLPSSGLFDEVEHWAAEVAQLRELVLSVVEAQSTEARITAHEDFLRSVSERAPWLAAGIDDMGLRWRDAYPSGNAETASVLAADIERSQKATKEQLEKWEQAAAEVSEIRDKLEAVERSLHAAKDNLPAQISARKERQAKTEALVPALSRETDAQQGVLDAASPLGKYDAAPPVPQGASGEAASRVLVSAPKEENSQAQSLSAADADAETAVEGDDPSLPDAATTPPPPKPIKSDAVDTAMEGAAPIIETDDRSNASEPKEATDTGSGPHEDAMWRTLRNGRGGIAYQIARLVSEAEAQKMPFPASDLIACVVLGRAISSPEDRAAQIFARHAEAVLAAMPFEADDPNTEDALNLLLFSGAVRPALFAPMTGAISMLQGVEMSSSELAPVFQLTCFITRRARELQSVHLDLGQVSAILNGTLWKDRLESHIREVEAWRAAAESQEFLYKPATRVWRHWMHDGGILFELAKLISGSDAQPVAKVKKTVEELSDDKELTRLIDRTLRNKLNQKGAGRIRIMRRGRAQIDDEVAKAVDLACKWQHIIQSTSGSER